MTTLSWHPISFNPWPYAQESPSTIRWSFTDQANFSETPLAGFEWYVEAETRLRIAIHGYWWHNRGMVMIWPCDPASVNQYHWAPEAPSTICWSFFADQAIKYGAPLAGLECYIEVEAWPPIATHSCWMIGRGMAMIWKHSHVIQPHEPMSLCSRITQPNPLKFFR